MTNRIVAALVIMTLALAAERAVAQQPARIDGVLTDSTHYKPLSDAIIYITRIEPAQPEFMRTVVSDKDGRYHLDSLTAGRYSVLFTHPTLDSLDVPVAAREVVLTAGERARVDLGIPSGATLRRAACPGLLLAANTGAVVGTVTDADTDRPLIGASVAVTWNDITIDRTTLQTMTAARSGSVRVDSAGIYRLCGVPTGSYLLLQVQAGGRAGSVLRTEVSDSVGFRRLDLTFSAVASRALVSADTTEPPPLTGTAVLTGTVRNSTGLPLADVTIRVEDAAGTARTDSLGHFRLSGLPAGSQLVEALRIGYFIGRMPVALRSGRTVDIQLSVDRIVSLDSVRVIAQRSRYREFEQHKRSSVGRYFTEEQITQRHASETAELFRMMPGFRVVGSGFDSRVVSTRGGGAGRNCAPNIVIDNMQNQDLSIIHPYDIGAMEVYNDLAGGPPGANRGCGVIVIWTKR
ncbi:MAG: TonB-dependent receptor plug [Gemmatimonadetes bacterium]|nr:TonB-dependent receptor plug [Gemmatimonadota bacterium]